MNIFGAKKIIRELHRIIQKELIIVDVKQILDYLRIIL